MIKGVDDQEVHELKPALPSLISYARFIFTYGYSWVSSLGFHFEGKQPRSARNPVDPGRAGWRYNTGAL
jgi:hypothetical protein